jgi:predicted amidophosphoribosyltransferase
MVVLVTPQTRCPCPSGGAVPTIGFVRIGVNECWAVDLHWRGEARTPMGDLVSEAKTYAQGKPGDRDAAERLGACLAWWAQHLAAANPQSKIEEASVVCAVPANPRKAPFNLPDLLAEQVAAALNVRCDLDLVVKRRPTNQIKYEADRVRKVAALQGAFEATRPLDSQTVVVVDDLVLSGATLEAVASALRSRGATRVIALVATRATKGLGVSHAEPKL